jgi:DNA recombination protein RmuC
MFVPVEPAYLLAISEDAQLWQDAWERNVLLVSPSTLLFVVRTVANLWRQEQQTQNAQDIARRGGELYDKFVGFVEALETVGGRLQQAQKAYEDAHKRLTSGRGSLVRQTEMLRELGVKPAKRIAEGLLDPNQDVDLLPIGPSADEAPAI